MSETGKAFFADYTLKRPPRNVPERLLVEAARRLWKISRVNVITSDSYCEHLGRVGFTKVEVEESAGSPYRVTIASSGGRRPSVS